MKISHQLLWSFPILELKPYRFQIWCQNRHVRPQPRQPLKIKKNVWACARLGGNNAYCKVIFLAHWRKHCCAMTLWKPTLCWLLFSSVWSDCVSFQPQQWIWMGWWVKVRICCNSWGAFLSSAKLYVSLILIGQLQCAYVARNNTVFAQTVPFNFFGSQASSSYWVGQQRLSTRYKEGNCQSNTGTLRPCVPAYQFILKAYNCYGMSGWIWV